MGWFVVNVVKGFDMKKIIAAIALSLSFTFSAYAVQFEHWKVGDGAINAFAELETGAEVGVIVFKDASVMIGINPKGGKLGDLIHKEDSEFYVDGQPIKGVITWYSNGGILITPETNKGSVFITNKLWSQKKITVKFKEFEFWISAKGVQKAWKYLQSVKQAI